ncbi:MAG: glycosyltransferase [Vicinamibacterales bacterium]
MHETFNRREFVGRAIASVWTLMRQPLEVIVVDDGSTDRTGEWPGRTWPGGEPVWQNNSGPAVAAIGAARSQPAN